MSIAEYVLNLGLLVYILGANLGTRRLTIGRVLLPLALVAVGAAVFLRHLPAAGNDATLEMVGALTGVALGVLAGFLLRVRPDERRHGLVTTAGIGYAALWVVVVGGRILFAYGAEHWFGPRIGRFSFEHGVSGADAWVAAFVLMALAMVATRVLTTTAFAARARRGLQVVIP